MAPIVFTKYVMSTKARLIGSAIFLGIGLLIGYAVGVKMYVNKDFEESIKVLKGLVKSRK